VAQQYRGEERRATGALVDPADDVDRAFLGLLDQAGGLALGAVGAVAAGAVATALTRL
jgi:hypothetical protein